MTAESERIDEIDARIELLLTLPPSEEKHVQGSGLHRLRRVRDKIVRSRGKPSDLTVSEQPEPAAKRDRIQSSDRDKMIAPPKSNQKGVETGQYGWGEPGLCAIFSLPWQEFRWGNF